MLTNSQPPTTNVGSKNKGKYLYFTYKQSNLVAAAKYLFSAVQNALNVADPSRFLRMATMNASTELVAGTLNVLSAFGSPDETTDILSRTIILEIAKANANGNPVRETDIVSKLSHTSNLTVHYRLKMLVETNLVTNMRNPADRRERLLYLTPLAQEKFDRLAQEIRQLREK